jgi:hypothetical protein
MHMHARVHSGRQAKNWVPNKCMSSHRTLSQISKTHATCLFIWCWCTEQRCKGNYFVYRSPQPAQCKRVLLFYFTHECRVQRSELFRTVRMLLDQHIHMRYARRLSKIMCLEQIIWKSRVYKHAQNQTLRCASVLQVHGFGEYHACYCCPTGTARSRGWLRNLI